MNQDTNQNQFEILTHPKQVIEKLRSCTQDINAIQSVELHCNGFMQYASKARSNTPSLGGAIYDTLLTIVKQKGTHCVTVYDHLILSEENLISQAQGESTKMIYSHFWCSQKAIKVIAKSDHYQVLIDFLSPIIEEAKRAYVQRYTSAKTGAPKTPRFDTLSEVFKNFMRSEQPFQTLQVALDKLKEDILTLLNKKAKKEEFDSEFSESIKKSLEEMLGNIDSIYQNSVQATFKAFCHFFIVQVPALFTLRAPLPPPITASVAVANFIYGFKDLIQTLDDQYRYTYMLPIIKILTQQIAPIFTLLSASSLKNILIIKTSHCQYFIDYSSMDALTPSNTLVVSLGCAIVGKLEDVSIDSQAYRSLSYTLEVLNQDNICDKFERHLKQTGAKFGFFCSPFFNSYKLVNWLQELSCSQAKNLNYLILCQCPTKHNAGLNQQLLHELGNVIKDPINRNRTHRQTLRQNPTAPSDAIIDYSKYTIEVQDQDKLPFVLSLSPFAVSKDKKCETFKYPECMIEINTCDAQDIQDMALIESFFQSPENLKYYFQKDKELFKKEIRLIQSFFQNVGLDAKVLQGADNMVSCKIYYPQDIIFLTLMFQVLKENYKEFKEKEHILTIQGEKITTLYNPIFDIDFKVKIYGGFIDDVELKPLEYNIDTILQRLGTPSLVFCQKSDLKNSFCIQTFAQDVFETNQEDRDFSKELFAIHFQNQQANPDQEILFAEFYTLLLASLIKCFPFMHMFDSPITLAKKFLSTMTSKDEKEAEKTRILLSLSQVLKIVKIFKGCNKECDQKCNQECDDGKIFLDRLGEIKKKYESNSQSVEIELLKIFEVQVKNTLKESLENLTTSSMDAIFQPKNLNKNNFIGDTFKDIAFSLFINVLSSIISLIWGTKYEKQKEEYTNIIYTKYTDVNHAPLAVKREGLVYYPITIHQTFLGFSFQSLILGGSLSTGGLGRAKSCFYALSENTTQNFKNTQNNFNIVRNYQLSLLFGLLCLDELRSGTILTQKDKMLQDEKFFSQDHSRKEFGRYKIDKEKHKEVYQQYSLSDEEDNGSNQSNPIESYNLAMTYLSDIQNGIFETNSKTNKIDPNKHRNFLRALDNIGKNNIKGLYVGIKKEKGVDSEKTEPRPKIIGRLATTIVMKDGLWIG